LRLVPGSAARRIIPLGGSVLLPFRPPLVHDRENNNYSDKNQLFYARG
jgi:hypothetical protein